MFWGIPWSSGELFSRVLSSSETFLNVMIRSLTFWGILRHSKAFWGVSLILYSSKCLGKVLRQFSTLWGFLSYPETFSWVLSGSERFLKVLWHSVTFWSVLLEMLVRSHGSERFLEVSDILWCFWCSEAFWDVLMGTEHFWKTPWRLEASSNVVGWSAAFAWLLKGFLRFWGVFWLSGVFCFVQKRSHGFWVVL